MSPVSYTRAELLKAGVGPYTPDELDELRVANALVASYGFEQDRYINAPHVWDALKHMKARSLQKPMKATTLRKRIEETL